MIEYIHATDSIVGSEDSTYHIEEEVLDYEGKKVLYLISRAEADFILGCDQSRVPAPKSIFVKGYVVEWKTENEKGEVISKLEPIKEESEQKEIEEILKDECGILSVYF